MMFAYSALVIGFLGSFHCVAMCGPIALALSGGAANNWKYLLGRSLYNSGRVFTYAFMGLVAGLLGHTLLMAGFQKSISISIGVLMILSVLVLQISPGKLNGTKFLMPLNKSIKSVFSGVIKSGSKLGLFLAGMANGILPCGFVYLAMAGAAATQHALDGACYMIFFGLGTFPAMMAVAAFGKIAGLKARTFLTKAAPLMMIILGLLFIYRGVSMKDHSCCHKVSAERIGE